ncbi:hypothetical protein AVEN_192799-1 [Araneus ventricosus]|uniref:Uncharacterized protein n=1 Tax=Araneus ventricosus TaxID=182803 RepID=A0A4Y2TPE3_ARAVE|nr:hypothetical protein AVEN_192799-1 [Araneus ventricosus]
MARTGSCLLALQIKSPSEIKSKRDDNLPMTPDLRGNPPSSPMKLKLTSNNMIKTLGPIGFSDSIRNTYLSTAQLGNSQGSFTKSLLFLIRMGSSTPPGKANAFKYSFENSLQTNQSLTKIDTSPKLTKQFSISSIAREMTTISNLPLPSKFKL